MMMTWSVVRLLFLLLTSALCRSNLNGFQLDGSEASLIHPDDGWHVFSFTLPNAIAHPQFSLCINHPSFLRVTDAFCPGDTFSVFANGTFIGSTSEPAHGTGCNQVMGRPEEAYFSANYSHADFRLEPGAYGINVLGKLSPYSNGLGYIRVDSIEPQVLI